MSVILPNTQKGGKTMTQESKKLPKDNKRDVLDVLSDLLIGISMVTKSIGCLLKAAMQKGESNEEEGHDGSDNRAQADQQ